MPLLRARFGSPYDVPTGPFDIAEGYPTALGLRALWLPGVVHDGQQLINLAPERVPGGEFLPPATSDVPAPTTILQGPAALFTGAAGGGYYRRSSSPWLSGTLTCTIACMFTWGGSQTGFPSFYGLTNGSGGDRYYSLVPNSGQLAYNINLGQGDIIINAVSMAAGHTYLAIGTTRAANDHEVMVLNITTGAIAGGTSSSGAGASNPTLTDEVLGGANYGSHNYLDGRVAAAFGWSRGFTQAELRDFLAQPWDMLAPRGRVVRGFALSSGGDTALAAQASASGTAAAALTTEIRLASAAAASGLAGAALTTAIRPAAAALGAGAAAAALSTSIRMQAGAGGSGQASGALSTAIPLGAAAAGAGSVTAALTTAIRLAADAAASGTAAAALAADGAELRADASGSGLATASLATSIRLTAAPAGSGIAAGTLTTGIRMTAAAAGAGQASAGLTTAIRLLAHPAGSGTAIAALTAPGRMLAAAAGMGIASAVLGTGIRLVAAAAAHGLAGASLADAEPLAPDPRRTVGLSRPRLPALPAPITPDLPRRRRISI